METERSIVLQKKTILFLSLVIGVILGIIYGREVKLKEQEMYLSKLDIVTVNAAEDENEILRKNIKYSASKVIKEDEIFTFSSINSEKIEAFAGDVISLVDEKNNENVANNESTDEINILDNNINIEKEETNIEEAAEQTEVVNESIEELKVNNDKPKTVRYRDLAEDNPPEEYERIVEASATAYCLCKKCCGKSPDHPYYGYTRSGLKIEQGTGIKVIAVDPNVIPLNTKVYVEGLNGAWDYGHAVAADTGSAIKELKIDLYMDTHEEALEWGRRKVNVYVLGE